MGTKEELLNLLEKHETVGLTDEEFQRMVILEEYIVETKVEIPEDF